MAKKLKPIHPGEILAEEFLGPLAISQYRLAKDIAVAPIRISEIIHGNRAISVDTALRLGKYFNTSPQFWLSLQTHYDLTRASESLAGVLRHKVKIFDFAV